MAVAAVRGVCRSGLAGRCVVAGRCYSSPMTPKHPVSGFNRMVLRVTGTLDDDSVTEVR